MTLCSFLTINYFPIMELCRYFENISEYILRAGISRETNFASHTSKFQGMGSKGGFRVRFRQGSTNWHINKREGAVLIQDTICQCLHTPLAPPPFCPACFCIFLHMPLWVSTLYLFARWSHCQQGQSCCYGYLLLLGPAGVWHAK